MGVITGDHTYFCHVRILWVQSHRAIQLAIAGGGTSSGEPYFTSGIERFRQYGVLAFDLHRRDRAR